MGEDSSVIRSLARRDFLAAFFVVVNSLSWYFPLFVLVTEKLDPAYFGYFTVLALFGVHYVTVIASALVGIFLVPRIMSRRVLLLLWMILGVISTLLVSTIETGSQVWLFSTVFALGISLGLGFPTCLAYFADYGVTARKGRIGGLTYCVAGLGIFSVGLLTFLTGNLLQDVAILTAWRLVGLLVFVLVQPHGTESKQVEVAYRKILNDRSFLLYLIPWLMFGLVNYLEGPVFRSLNPEIFNLVPVAEFGVGSIVAFVAGFFSDMVGRKRVVMFGFIMLGVGYAVLGLTSGNVFSLYFYVAVDGVAWGILALMFFLILWGELAENRVKDKYYFLGVLPFLISSYSGTIAAPFVVSNVDYTQAFSFASFFLFVAVLPLMYAPETLPQKNIELRRLRNYLESAKKLKGKYPEK